MTYKVKHRHHIVKGAHRVGYRFHHFIQFESKPRVLEDLGPMGFIVYEHYLQLTEKKGFKGDLYDDDEIAEQLGVSPNRVKMARNRIMREGYMERVRGTLNNGTKVEYVYLGKEPDREMVVEKEREGIA